MKSKTSFFSISDAVIRENFRRFWVLPLLIFVSYFLTGTFYLIVNFRSVYGLPHFINMLLEGRYPLYSLIILAAPVLTSVILFDYLNKTGSVMTVHAQPFTRSALLNSHAVSAVLFCVLPILATGLILLLMAHPVYYPEEYYSSPGDMRDLFTRMEVLKWIWEATLSSLFVLSVCIFARMITGTAFHHVVASLGFNLVTPLILFLMYSYLSRYLFGFEGTDYMHNLLWTSPVLKLYDTEHFKAITSLLYMVIIVAVYALSMFLYHKRKLERTTEGVVFDVFNYIINMIFAFLGMTLLGMMFDSVFHNTAAVAAGYIIGALLGLIVCRMIVLKSLKVMNRTTLKMVGVYAVLAAVFFVVVCTDLTGYEKRVPEGAETVKISGIGGLLDDYGDYPETISFEGGDVQIARELHQYIIDDEEEIRREENNRYEAEYADSEYDPFGYGPWEYTQLRFDYLDAGDRTVASRTYSVNRRILHTEAMENLLLSEAWGESFNRQIPAADDWAVVSVHGAEDSDDADAAVISDDEAMRQLREMLLKDRLEEDYENLLYGRLDKMPVGVLSITFEAPDDREEPVSENTSNYSAMDISLHRDDRNTLRWLQEHGYAEALPDTLEGCDLAVVYTVKEGSVREILNRETDERGNLPRGALEKEETFLRSVEDPAQIMSLYNAMYSTRLQKEDVTTEKDDVYLVLFMSRDGSVSDGETGRYWQMASGLVNGKDLPAAAAAAQSGETGPEEAE